MGRPIPCRLFYVKIHLFSWIIFALLSCSSIVRAEGPLLKPYLNGTGPVESFNDCLLHTSLAINVTPSGHMTSPAWLLWIHKKLTAVTNSYNHSWTDANTLGAHVSETTLILLEDSAPFFGSYLPALSNSAHKISYVKCCQ